VALTLSQNQDLVRQLNELRVQNQSLSTQNQTQSNRIHDLSTKLLAFGSGTPVSIPRQMGSSTMMAPMVPAPAGSMGPPPLPAKRGFLSVYDLYKQEGSERGAVFGEAPHPRRSRDMALMGVKG
jgi:hypothetical protein